MIDVYSEGLHSIGKRNQTISTSGLSFLKSHSGKKSQEYRPTTDGKVISGTLKMSYFISVPKEVSENIILVRL